MKLILVDSQVALIPSMRSYSPGHELRASITRHPHAGGSPAMAVRDRLGRLCPDRHLRLQRDQRPSAADARSRLLMTGSTDSAIANRWHQCPVRAPLDRRADGRAGGDNPAAAGRGTRTIRWFARSTVRADQRRASLCGRRKPAPKATPAVLNEPRASPRGRNSERNLGEKFHTGCAGQATLTRGSTTGNVRYPGFLAEDLVLALPIANTIGLWA